ncbi:hypothetical protein HID58_056679 [Brassica napus]|uniref:Uncharacterized protein n=1 Tax=Brassica napus TaxID=3708 RepID=A0ABQ8AQH9_BRANA|nr:hypothetical protein HID58_056679 [Brassica napus]
MRSGDEYYVRCLVESDLKDLASKCTIAVYIWQGTCFPGSRRLFNHKGLHALKKTAGDDMVRGIVREGLSLDKCTFNNMRNLRYLKLYSSHCHRQCKADCKLNFPDELELPLDRYEPSQRLRPQNLTDLNLPYSTIEEPDQTVSSNQHLGKLVRLNMKDCVHLTSLPDMADLELLQVLDLSGCSKLSVIQGFPRNLKELYLGGTAIEKLPQVPLGLEILNAHGQHFCKECSD